MSNCNGGYSGHAPPAHAQPGQSHIVLDSFDVGKGAYQNTEASTTLTFKSGPAPTRAVRRNTELPLGPPFGRLPSPFLVSTHHRVQAKMTAMITI